MSTFPFNPRQGPIIVEVQATGPAKTTDLKLLLDTGATTSLINLKMDCSAWISCGTRS